MINIIQGYPHRLLSLSLILLEKAQELFGKQTGTYVYGGVELKVTGPRINFPHRNYVTIQLTPDCQSDFCRAIFQLSHEVVHLLSPLGKPTTNKLEEGLAVYFSKVCCDQLVYKGYAEKGINGTIYQEPYEKYMILHGYDPNAILKLRHYEPSIGLVKKDSFLKAQLGIPDEVIDFLISEMQY